ncbi:MAG: hypothetical protein U1E17_01160 [Geminicoccaceae bacterium]
MRCAARPSATGSSPASGCCYAEGFVGAPGAPEFQVTATLPELFDRLEIGHRARTMAGSAQWPTGSTRRVP